MYVIIVTCCVYSNISPLHVVLMIPKPANLFDAWQMDPDSEGMCF